MVDTNAWKLVPVFVQGTLGENEEMPCDTRMPYLSVYQLFRCQL